MTRSRLLAVLVVCCLSMPACWNEGDPAGEEGWWLVDSSGFSLADGGMADEELRRSVGQRWLLEYSNGVQTLQLSAWDVDTDFMALVQQDPEVGSATVEGFDVTLRQGAGVPADDIPPGVGAEWTDGDVFMSFGGGPLSEAELRSLLHDLHRVAQTDWEAAVGAIPESP